MKIKDKTYISNEGISFKGLLKLIAKSSETYQPIFEAFTNSIEAIRGRFKENIFEGKIYIKIYANELTSNKDFDSIVIEDNGVGFDSECFNRFNKLWDDSKGYKNKGSGRIQYVHFFDRTEISSVFKENDNTYFRRFIVSKSKEFIKHDSILYHVETKKTDNQDTQTVLKFSGLLQSNEAYIQLDAIMLEKELLNRYLEYFCLNRNNLPQITIQYYLSNELKQTRTINSEMIPISDETIEMVINYASVSTNGKNIIYTDSSETFNITPFKISSDLLGENEVKMTSKSEIIKKTHIDLDFISKRDSFNNQRFLFLISSNYIDNKDLESDLRGEDIKFSTKEEFSNKRPFNIHEDILLDDIQSTFSEIVLTKYPEINKKKELHSQSLTKLKEMFFIDDSDLNVKISLNDSDESILSKYYKKEAEKEANLDSEIKQIVDNLDRIDTSLDTYQENLQQEIDKLVKVIPQQNKNTLTHYVARRKLVLELFDKVLKQELRRQNEDKRNIDERLLHNLIFQQSSNDTENSDLWLLNEEFLYFKGTSEKQLKDVIVEGEKLIRDDLNEEEHEYMLSLEENRYEKRPDILLFPQESKCIIIEFKNPKANVSDHLNQINNYATLIWNFTNKKFNINTFYGYLIGLKVNPSDVRAKDGDFKEAFKFDYAFRPHKSIAGLFSKNNQDASLYTEVIKYTTLLERANKRNEIFMDKLGVLKK